MRIGFLFNHYSGHQALHAVPVAFELSRRYPQASINIIGSDRHVLDDVQKLSVLSGRTAANTCLLMCQHTSPWSTCSSRPAMLIPGHASATNPASNKSPCRDVSPSRAKDELLDYVDTPNLREFYLVWCGESGFEPITIGAAA